MLKVKSHWFVAAGTLIVVGMIGCGGNGTGSFGSTSTTSGTYDPSNQNRPGGPTGANGQPIAGTPATTMPGNEILYVEYGDAGTVIQRMAADGKHVVPLTKLSGGEPIYAQDPSAMHVVFPIQKDSGLGLFYNTSTSPDNANAIGPVNYTAIGSVQFAPDGEDVLYTAESASQPFSVYYASTTGKLVKRLDAGDDASISPNGKFVAYSKQVGGKGQIFVVGVDGKGSHLVSQSKGDDILPQWSKDSKTIFLTSDRDGTFSVYEIPSSGGKATKLAAGLSYGLTSSPDGKKIAYSRIDKDPDNTGLFIAKNDGSLAHKVSDTPAATGLMYWTTPSVAPGKKADHPAAPALSISPRAKQLLKLPDAPIVKKADPKTDGATKPDDTKKADQPLTPPPAVSNGTKDGGGKGPH